MNGGQRKPVKIANCSGFFGDRLAAAREMVDGGPIDVLTGDWLAELTMLILARQRMKHGEGAGWARTFLTQMEQVLGSCLERGIKVVSNAGGLDPAGAAAALRAKAEELGLSQVKIAYVTGDDLLPKLGEWRERLINLDTGEPFDVLGTPPLTANAYLGARGITAALAAGADVVITGRVTDAALAIGPAAWWHGWSFDDAITGDQGVLDSLAGALVAGHVIECGPQATGGNYPFFADVPGIEHIGFPIAEVAADGSCVITKHPGTGGMVTTGTVTAQLLYELGSPAYLNPDVTARFDTISLSQHGPDRVAIRGARGQAPPDRLKVCVNTLGGFRNTMSLVLTGLDAEAKADVALRTITGLRLADVQDPAASPASLAQRSRLNVRELDIQLLRQDRPDPVDLAQAQAHLRITVKDADPKNVGRRFTAPVIESALASYPGMYPTAPPAEGTPFGLYWPTSVAAVQIRQQVWLDGDLLAELPGGGTGESIEALVESAVEGVAGSVAQAAGSVVGSVLNVAAAVAGLAAPADDSDSGAPGRSPRPGKPAAGTGAAAPPNAASWDADDGEVTELPLGLIAGARSGDKGGNANVGFWIPEPAEGAGFVPDSQLRQLRQLRYEWLRDLLAPERIRELLPEAADLEVTVHPLPLLYAVNVVIAGLLGRGVAESSRLDPQAKGLGEQFRARVVAVPVRLAPRSVLSGGAD